MRTCPLIAEALRNQVPRLIEPALNLTQGQLPIAQIIDSPHPTEKATKTKVARRTKRNSPATNGESRSAAVDWTHKPEKWGVPRQSWKAWQKIIWLLRVATQESNQTELSGPSIAETFNKHFRQAGLLAKQSMPRDLGALKQRSPAFVSDDATKAPITWFLTEEGAKEADKLISEAVAGGTSSTLN